LVAQNPQTYAHCSNPRCDNVLLLKSKKRIRICCCFKKQSKLLECEECQNEMCKLCKQSYHGEREKCSKVNDLTLWARGSSRHRIRNCPNCKVLIEKELGCPHMICNSCGHEFCWICSLKFESLTHLLSTPFCVFMNLIVYNDGDFDGMFVKCIWLRFLACYLLFITAPALMIVFAPIFTLTYGPCFFK